MGGIWSQSAEELKRNGSQPGRGDGKRFVVRADEKLTAFMELEAAIHSHS
jgi:hypothetical protein